MGKIPVTNIFIILCLVKNKKSHPKNEFVNIANKHGTFLKNSEMTASKASEHTFSKNAVLNDDKESTNQQEVMLV